MGCGLAGADSLVGWRTRHEELARRLVVARRYVPEPEPAFRAAFQAFDAALTLHLAQEERWILPAFDRVGERAAPNQRPHVVRADHARLEADLVTLRAPADPVVRAVTLAHLADLLDHHDRREAAGMLPLVDELLGDQVAAVLAAIHAEEASLPPVDLPPLTPSDPLPRPDLPPIALLRWAAAHDQPLVEVPVPDHPRGSALHARLRAAVEVVGGALESRRDALAAVIDRLRLVEVVSRRG